MKLSSMEINDQYAALAKAVQEVRRVAGEYHAFVSEARPKSIICVGCGSSFMLSRSMAAVANARFELPAFAYTAGELWLNAEFLPNAMRAV